MCNIFLDEYKEIFFPSNLEYSLEEMFIFNNQKFSEVNNEGLDIYPKSFYKNILENILQMEFSDERLFKTEDKSINTSESGPTGERVKVDFKEKKSKNKFTILNIEIPIGTKKILKFLIS